jgi:amidase
VATHDFEPTVFHLTLGSHEPVLRVASGDTVRTWCVDSSGYDREGRDLTAGGNPQTGPFFVEGAEPGDTLAVHLERIAPNRNRGVTGQVVALNVVDPWLAAELPESQGPDWWTLDLERQTARMDDPPPELESLGELPLAPMLGCFGVAPPGGQAISTATSGEHGGNMDYRGFRTGVTVYFPVFVEGALFFLGDAHALQGDGEFVMAVGNARPFDQALQHATSELMRLLLADYGLSYRASSALLGQCIRYEVGNVFDPAYTAVAKVPKRLLP